MTAGSAGFRIGSRTFAVEARRPGSCKPDSGALVMFRAMVEHQLLWASPDFAMWVVYSPPIETEGSELCIAKHLAPIVSDGARRVRGAEFQVLHEACAVAHANRNARAMHALFAQMATTYRLAAPDLGADPAVVRALWLLEHDVQLGRAELASKIKLSEGELSRRVHAALGTTLVRHRRRLRLARFVELAAARRARVACRSLLELGYEAGFGSSAALHRAFADETGLGPAAYLSGKCQQLTALLQPLGFSADQSNAITLQ